MVALVAGTIFASLRETFIWTVVPCTTWPFFGEMIVSLAGLAGRSALTVGVGESVLGGVLPLLPHAHSANTTPATRSDRRCQPLLNRTPVQIVCEKDATRTLPSRAVA